MLTYVVTASLAGAPIVDMRSLLRDRVMRPIGIPDSEWSCGYGKTQKVKGLPLVASWGGGAYSAGATARVARLVCTETQFARLWKGVFGRDWAKKQFWYPDAANTAYGPRHEQDIRNELADVAGSLSPKWQKSFAAHARTDDRRDTGDRAQLRAEIDAYVAHLYGLSRDDFEYILGTFPVLERKEQKAFGEFMSKRKCLEEYDRIGAIL